MTITQRNSLMISWWPAACRAQGWKVSDRAKRLEVISQAVGRFIGSANQLNNTSDIDAVKAHLGMLADNISSTIETDHPERGETRRFINRINSFPAALTRKMLSDRFTWSVWLRHNHPAHWPLTKTEAKKSPLGLALIQQYEQASPSAPTLEDLAVEELQQLLATLTAITRGSARRAATSFKPEVEPTAEVLEQPF